jgi:hypothetical protein
VSGGAGVGAGVGAAGVVGDFFGGGAGCCCVVVAVVVVVVVYEGTYEYGEETVCPVNCG